MFSAKDRTPLSDRLARFIFQLMEGDTAMVDDLYALLTRAGYCNEAGEEIFLDDD